MRIEIEDPSAAGRRPAGSVLFAAGFRPFFLLAGLQAALAMAGWLAFYFGSGTLPQAFFPVVWHGHEMVFGFAAAAVAGFLLTAVPNWTGTRPVSGPPLMLLSALWLAGRIVFWLSAALPAWIVAAVDLAFLPVLAFLVGRPIVQAGNKRNLPFLPILGLFWLGEVLVQLEPLAGADTGMTGIRLGIWVLLVMIAIVGGRIIPSFTGNWLRMQGQDPTVRAQEWVERAAPAAVAAAGLADVFVPAHAGTGLLLLVAAALHGWRLAGWRGVATLREPILWVLHVGYLWLVVGLALRGASVFAPGAVPPSAALHALTTGAVATMVMGVMTRAALGHSGRPLRISTAIAWAYGLVSVGAFIRAFGPIVHPSAAGDLVPAVSGTLWMTAWLVYVWVYAPICTRPRADGRPG